MENRKKISASIAILALSFACNPAEASSLVDTGGAVSGTEWTLSPSQDLAAYFTVSSATTITAVRGFIAGSGAGTDTIKIYSDGSLPNAANVLFSDTFTSTASNGWQGISGKNWAVAAGNYWVSFSSNQSEGMFNGATSPLTNYAFTNGGNWFSYSSLNLGVQIDAGTGAVPEPATWAMMLLGFGMVGFAMRKRSNVRTTVCYA